MIYYLFYNISDVGRWNTYARFWIAAQYWQESQVPIYNNNNCSNNNTVYRGMCADPPLKAEYYLLSSTAVVYRFYTTGITHNIIIIYIVYTE